MSSLNKYLEISLLGIKAGRKRKILSPYHRTANEGRVRIQYKCLVPIYVFPEMKLCSILISKTEL